MGKRKEREDSSDESSSRDAERLVRRGKRSKRDKRSRSKRKKRARSPSTSSDASSPSSSSGEEAVSRKDKKHKREQVRPLAVRKHAVCALVQFHSHTHRAGRAKLTARAGRPKGALSLPRSSHTASRRARTLTTPICAAPTRCMA